MATKLAKPNGEHLLDTDDAAKYMANFTLDTLPGVGSSMTYKLNQAGFKTCGDVQLASLARLETLLGKKMALTLHQNCHGIDLRPLVYEQVRHKCKRPLISLMKTDLILATQVCVG